jgi:hypothetical protein
VIEAGGTWKRDGDGEILELKGGQSLTGRLCTLDVADGMGPGCEYRPGTFSGGHFAGPETTPTGS